MKFRTHKHKVWSIFWAIVFSALLGSLFEWYYSSNFEAHLPVAFLEKVYQYKAHKAENGLLNLKQCVDSQSYATFTSPEKNIYYYVVNKENELVYWSSNEIDPTSFKYDSLPEHFVTLGHSKGVLRQVLYKDMALIYLIKIKDDYQTSNNYIYSHYASQFLLNAKIELSDVKEGSATIIHSADGRSLFQFNWNTGKDSKHILGYLSLICWGVFYLLFLVSISLWHRWFGGRFHELKWFMLGVLVYAAILAFMFIEQYPQLLFSTEIFSSLHYDWGQLPSSFLPHILLSIFILSVAINFYWRVYRPVQRFNLRRSRFILIKTQLIMGLLFVWMIYVIKLIIDHTDILISISNLELISVNTVLLYLLLFSYFSAFIVLRDKLLSAIKYSVTFFNVMLYNMFFSMFAMLVCYLIGQRFYMYISLFYMVYCLILDAVRYYRPRVIRFYHIVFLILASTAFTVWLVTSVSEQKHYVEYARLASDHSENMEDYDVLTLKMIEELESNIQKDRTLTYYMGLYHLPEKKISNYLLKYYFYGYWENYNVVVHVSNRTNNTFAQKYKELTEKQELVPYSAHNFYHCTTKGLMDYLGVFAYPQSKSRSTYLYVELQKKVLYEDYGYPDVVFQTGINRLTNLVSSAYYIHHKLVKHTGNHVYSIDEDLFAKGRRKIYENGAIHYIFPIGKDRCMIFSEQGRSPVSEFLVDWIYLFTLYVVVLFIVFYSVQHRDVRSSMPKSYFSAILNSFILYVVGAISIVIVVMAGLFFEQYKTNQDDRMRDYLSLVRQELTQYTAQNKDELTQGLNLDYFINQLSHEYRTDIHLYDTKGTLLSTSRETVFTSQYQSKLMSTAPYFSAIKDMYFQQEYLGTLRYKNIYAAIYNEKDQLVGYVSLPSFFSKQTMWHEFYGMMAWMLLLFYAVLALASLASWLISIRLTRPIRVLESKLKAIRLGRKNEKIEYVESDADEITQLIDQYNQMVDQLAQSAKQLSETERQLAWREMARQIAHEIKNPLTPMLLSVQMLLRRRNTENFDNYLTKTAHTLIEQINSLTVIANEFSNFARMPAAHFAVIDIVERVTQTVNLYKNNPEGVKISYDSGKAVALVYADADQMLQVFSNIIKNAIQAIPEEQEGQVSVILHTDEKYVYIDIADNGMGITPEAQEKLFVPSFTTKTSGMGLGLGIVKNIIHLAHGELSFTTKQGEGTVFTIKLLLYDE